VQFRGKETEQVGDAALDLRYLDLVLFECVGIDDRRIDAAQIQQRVQVFRGAPGDDRQDMQIRSVVDDARDFRRKAKRRALEQTAGEADRPRVHLVFIGAGGRGGLCLADALCLGSGWLKHQHG